MDIFGKNSPALVDILSERVMAKLLHVATLVKYTDGQFVHSRGDEKPGFTIVKKGRIRLGNYGVSGEFAPVSILRAGQCFGGNHIFANLPCILDCYAIGQTELYKISADDVALIADAEPELVRAFLRIQSLMLFSCLDFIDDIRRLPLHVRTAKFFLSLLSPEQTIIDGSQGDLAKTLGVSRVSLGKALKKLAGLGLIELGYSQITVKNVSELAIWVDQFNEIVTVKSD